MSTPRARFLALAALTAMTLVAVPAGAVTETTTTFVLEASGDLEVAVPEDRDLGLGSTGGGTLSASLGTVTVADNRGALLGSWTASVTATDFTTGEGSANETIGKDRVSYWSGAQTAGSGVAVRVAGQLTGLLAVDLSASRTAFSATGTVGNNTTSWAPTVIVDVPASAVIGTYTGTITHSVG